MLKWVEIYKLR